MRGKFKQIVTELAERDDKVIVILGDVSVYQFDQFRQRWPDRFYNMGILEPTLISVTAGLSAQGFFPFVHTIAPFLTERCYEQIKLDLCYNRFGGNIVTCGASFDYAWDGPTHHAYTDLAILRLLPGMEVMQPGSRRELDVLIRTQYANGNPSYFRLSDHPHDVDTGEVVFGRGTVVHRGSRDVTVITAGPLLGNVLEAVRDLDVNLLSFHTIKPIDQALIAQFAHTRILVVHDAFGLKEAVNEVAGLRVWYHGFPDQFCGWYGKLDDIRQKLGLDATGIRAAVLGMLENRERR
ncbi:MAG: hypothetical protein HQL87_04440 [Magnetococcales bacterium]|nr:hypothetical protein [Magnetococcales bacterium]